ncbi:UNVERIFIED_CONTAM: hypothetical protein NCL1_25644 [Trichonephila clavipes]
MHCLYLADYGNVSNIQTSFFLVNYMSIERQSLKNAWNKLWPDLKGEKDYNDDHREEITDFVPSIPGFQEGDE